MSSTAIKISSELANAARQAAEAAHRSLTGQIEHWASIGRQIEGFLPVSTVEAIKNCKGDLSNMPPLHQDILQTVITKLFSKENAIK